MKNNTISALSGLFAAVLIVGALTAAPIAHADDDGGAGDGGCCTTYTEYSNPTPSTTYTEYSNPNQSTAYTEYSEPAYGTAYTEYGEPTYGTAYTEYGNPSYDSQQELASYLSGSGTGSSGYSTGGYSFGGGFTGSGYLASAGYYTSPSYLHSQGVPSNTNVNTCTAVNSCNTNYDDHSIFNAPTTVVTDSHNIVTTAPPATQVVYTTPAQPPYVNYCTTCSCNSSYCQHYAYNNTPYVSLSAVPYTGLDLGFWGTIAYWSFLVLWCLAAAYLVIVKKVQNRIFRALGNFLFGSTTSVVTHEAPHAPMQVAFAAPVAMSVAVSEDAIDPFILSQVNRAR